MALEEVARWLQALVGEGDLPQDFVELVASLVLPLAVAAAVVELPGMTLSEAEEAVVSGMQKQSFRLGVSRVLEVLVEVAELSTKNL